jgi:hypothetical protein
MTNTEKNQWAALRRLFILRILDKDRDCVAMSAEACVRTLHAMRIRKQKEMRYAPPLAACGFNVSAIRRDFAYLEREGFIDIWYVRHTGVTKGLPAKFKVAHITIAGHMRARGEVFTF